MFVPLDGAKERRIVVSSSAAIAIYFLSFAVGRQYYISTEFASHERAFVIFPGLVAALVWFGLLHTWRESGKTGYRMAMEKLSTRKEKIIHALSAVAGLFLIPYGIALASIGPPACIAFLLAEEPFVQSFVLSDIKQVSWGYELVLWSKQSREGSSVRVNYAERDNGDWNREDNICVRGRTSIFGTRVTPFAEITEVAPRMLLPNYKWNGRADSARRSPQR